MAVEARHCSRHTMRCLRSASLRSYLLINAGSLLTTLLHAARRSRPSAYEIPQRRHYAYAFTQTRRLLVCSPYTRLPMRCPRRLSHHSRRRTSAAWAIPSLRTPITRLQSASCCCSGSRSARPSAASKRAGGRMRRSLSRRGRHEAQVVGWSCEIGLQARSWLRAACFDLSMCRRVLSTHWRRAADRVARR